VKVSCRNFHFKSILSNHLEAPYDVLNTHSHIHTHTHTYIYIYIHILFLNSTAEIIKLIAANIEFISGEGSLTQTYGVVALKSLKFLSVKLISFLILTDVIYYVSDAVSRNPLHVNDFKFSL
jgi:hypothetical protein